MFKKIFYSLTILAMLFGMFGMMGKGSVQPAFAATGNFYDVRATALAAPVPLTRPTFLAGYGVQWATNTGFYAEAALNMDIADTGGPAVGDLAGCSVTAFQSTVADRSQQFLYDANIGAATRYVQLHMIDAVLPGSLALGVFRASDGAELGCTLGTFDGAQQNYDLVITVPANTPYYVVVANAAIPAAWPGAGAYPVSFWMQKVTNAGGGFILNGVIPNEVVQVYNGTISSMFVPQAGEADAWFDLPAGSTWAIGVSNSTTAYAAAYPAFITGDFRAFIAGTDDPATAASVVITLSSLDETGAALAANCTVKVIPSAGFLPFNMDVGAIANAAAFNVSPGGWDGECVLDQALAAPPVPDYYLVGLNNIWNAPVTWNLNVANSGAQVDINTGLTNVPGAYADGNIVFNPDGPLNPVNDLLGTLELVNWAPDAALSTWEETVYVMAGVNNNPRVVLSEAAVIGTDWDYWYTPTNATWNFGIGSSGAAVYSPIFGRLPLRSSASITAGATSLNFNRAAWTDAFGNTLFRITAVDADRTTCIWGNATNPDGFRDEIAPCFYYQRGIDVNGPTLLANDWLTTTLGSVTAIGRYGLTLELQTGPDVTARVYNTALPAATAATRRGYITVSDVDLDNPFFNYIMGLYEAGITSGVTATSYGADLPITRGQLARYMSQAMVYGGLVKPAGPATATFTDVPTTHVFYADVQWMTDLGITSGVSSTSFGVNDPASRETMAVWAEKGARWMDLSGAPIAPAPFAAALGTRGVNGVCWDSAFLGAGTICNSVYFDALFDDVPSANANALWIEEAAADGITVGITGLPGSIWMYGPALPITRGQMAAFIGRSMLDANTYMGGWTFPSPPK